MYNFKNKNLFSDNILKANKNNKYYYDFGTGKKIEREEVKKERDAFLEGFNGTKTTAGKEENDPFFFDEPKVTYQSHEPAKETKYQARTFSPEIPETLTKRIEEKQKDTWFPYLGGDLVSDKDKELFLDGFAGRNEASQKQTQDDIEFGNNQEVLKILKDLGSRWYDATPEEQTRLHGVAEEVRRLARGGNQVKYGTDEIFDVMHKNAKTGQLVKGVSLGTIPIQSVLTNPVLAGVSGSLLEPGAFLTAMTDYGPWDYKWKSAWQTPGTTIVENGKEKEVYDGKDLNAHNQKNYTPWIYFDGHLIGADKFGNMNMAYVGRKMGLPEWVYKNSTTMDDPEDIFWIDKGTSYAESGR